VSSTCPSTTSSSPTRRSSGPAPVAKALAVMERHDTTYLFVIDGDHYLGTISIMGVAAAALALGES
jgi:hypothetical protein